MEKEAPGSSPPSAPDTPVRRWTHPIAAPPSEAMSEAMIYYLRCALSYQNQQLAEIRSLLEQLLLLLSPDSGPPPPQ